MLEGQNYGVRDVKVCDIVGGSVRGGIGRTVINCVVIRLCIEASVRVTIPR